MKEGFEPPTLGLWFQRSNQLNYFILFQLHVPVQLPCYDFIQIINLSMDFIKIFKRNWFFASDGRCVQGQVTCSPQRADLRLLVIPTSCKRVAVYNPNWENFCGLTQNFFFVTFCNFHCSTCVAQFIRVTLTWLHSYLPSTYRWPYF